MSKRSATNAALGAPPSKRLNLSSFDDDDEYIDDYDDDMSTAQTPSSIAEIDSPATAATGATTPRAKFPSDLKTLACTWPGCPKSFNRPARLRDHLNSHTNSRPFKCPYDGCDKDYIEDKHLKQHIKAVHTNERKHVCPREGCGKSFVTGTRLKRHQAVHEGAERFRCQDCGQSFRKKETLSKHVRKEHQGLPAFRCPVEGCKVAKDSKSSIKRHCEADHGEAKFWCSECGLKKMPDGTEQRIGFTTEVLLHAHVRQEHQDCMFCEYKSHSRWDLEQHIEVYHSGKSVEDRKNVECPYDNCTKKFTRKSNLTAHIRTAHEGYRYICGEVDLSNSGFQGWSNEQGCGGKFISKARLEDHVRYKHLGYERPKLSTTANTKQEETLPTGIIDEIAGVVNQLKHDVSCPHCPETFMRYYDLTVHLEKSHNDVALPILQGQHFAGQSPMLADNFGGPWSDDLLYQEDILAAQMDFGPAQDEWPEDEVNILLLARDPEIDPVVDPALQGLGAHS